MGDRTAMGAVVVEKGASDHRSPPEA